MPAPLFFKEEKMAVNLSKLIRTNTNDIDVDWPTLSRSPELEKYLTTLMDSLSMRRPVETSVGL